ncbi:unnamed protein product [Prorocentrum cordatum]|uniref:Poly [ADP-ribose] polymerase n=1 Tax=Prorocentrum cordatum TaxID=2364126 RepID=A0ABN9T147_9DINO|nr:unnamed protein product [Polarella glacialis]
MDGDGNNAVSKWEIFKAVEKHRELAEFFLPGLDCSRVMQDESTFDAVNCVFQSIAGGKKRFAYSDFEWHYRVTETRDTRTQRALADGGDGRGRKPPPDPDPRHRPRRLGYGRALNPPQANSLFEAGFQVRFIDDLPNPEHDQFPVQPYLQMIRQEIDAFKPDIMTAASKGGVYLVRLWQTGLWLGPSVLINAHPTCIQLPKNCPVVICSGDQDEVYRVKREHCDELIQTGTQNMTFLLFIGSSGLLPQGIRSREGDTHNMVSLTQNDCLPRLMDAVMDADGPEAHMIRTWRDRLSRERLQAEGALGYTPQALQKRWQSQAQRGLEDRKLWDVPRGSEEFRCVEAIFKARSREPPAYNTGPQANWDRRPVVAVQRIENGLQVSGSVVPYYNALRHSFEDQQVLFEPGVHTIWTWHGADATAIDSIINDPMQGMRPLAVGTRGASLWGKGTYLARDAKYVGEAGFCGQRSQDGTSRMLMCLTMIGIPCAGDPNHQGLLPYRRKPHRYHSSVDHLSTPEVFIVQQGGAVLPAYVAAAVAAAVLGAAAAVRTPPLGPDGARASSVPVRTVRRVIGTTYRVLPLPAAAAEEAPRAGAEPAQRLPRPWTPPGSRPPWTPQLAARASRGSLRPWEAVEPGPPAAWATPQLRLARSLSPRRAAQVAAAGWSSPPPGGYVVLQSSRLRR